MRTRVFIVAAAAVAASAMAAVLAAGGGAQAPSGRTLTFKETDRGSTFGIVDNPPRSRPRRGMGPRISVGDTLAFSQALVEGSGPATGTLHGTCTATTGRAQRFERAVFVCHATTTLANGTITLEAAVRFGDSGVTAAVTGGTGAYTGARGTFTSAGEPAVDTYTLQP